MYWVLVWRGIHCLTYRICFLNSAFCWKDKVARAGIWRQLGRSSNPILLLMGCMMLDILISISEHNYSFPPMGVIYFFVGLSWRSVNIATWYLEHSQGSVNINLLMLSFKSFCVVWRESGRRGKRESKRDRDSKDKPRCVCRTQQVSWKSHKEQEAPLTPGCVHGHGFIPTVCRCEIRERQILGRGKCGFCDFLWGCFLRSVSLCADSPPLPAPWPRNVPPQKRLNSPPGDEDVLGSDCADLGLNGWPGISEQELLMFKAALASRWHKRWERPTGWLAPCPHPGFQFIFICKAFGSEDMGLWLWCWVAYLQPLRILLWTECLCPPQIFMLNH